MAETGMSDGANKAEAEGSTTMELNLRLDGNGRTTFDPSLWPPSSDADTSSATAEQPSVNNDDSASAQKRAKLDGDSFISRSSDGKTKDPMQQSSMDYSSKTTLTNLANFDSSSTKALDDLLFDCEITDCGLLPRTFWIPAEGMEPRCYLEKMALEVFHHHVPKSPSSSFFYDPQTSGAEWWVQLRPSPPGTGRYSMLANPNDDDDMAKSGISFHWDKDEDLRIMCGGSMYIHPHISTVTYLTDLGAPTMVLTKRIDPLTGEYVQDEAGTEGFVSWPKQGKHLSFDGRFLHAAPSDLMEDGMFEKQCSFETAGGMDEKAIKILQRRHRRVTFLVNIWLNYKPFNVNPFPETMMNNLSKVDLLDVSLFGQTEKDGSKPTGNDDKSQSGLENVSICNGRAVVGDGDEKCSSNGCDSTDIVTMTWPMGCGEDEKVQVPMPLEIIRRQGQTGSDVALAWKGGVVLSGSGAETSS